MLWIDGIVALDVFAAPVAGGRAEKLLERGRRLAPAAVAQPPPPRTRRSAFQEDSPPDAQGRQELRLQPAARRAEPGPLAFRGGSPDDRPSGDRIHCADLAGAVLVAVRSAPGAVSG